MIVEIVPIRYLWSLFRRHAPLCVVLLALTVSGGGDWLPHADLAPTYHPPQYIEHSCWRGSDPSVETKTPDAELRAAYGKLYNDPDLDGIDVLATAVNPDKKAAAERFVHARDVTIQV